MSTDLEIRVPVIKINCSQTTTTSDDIITTDDGIDDERCTGREAEECHTPRSPRHMIPTTLICPPAPKKRRRSAACKRKLWELEFFETVAREEVESFFRTAEVHFKNIASTKRKCVM
ncbi:hypothetical protein Salat_0868300 [Sesamum alatum]|uniref:Uncharacterized protein n=1 Tax=Sesamum alatum TaxID=300844 RepID=A0AAE1YJD1_9LAMI|nr:hypothetical protein Salat_0868300 [Sesamum alatum]